MVPKLSADAHDERRVHAGGNAFARDDSADVNAACPVPGVRRAKVTIIGCGIAGTNAAQMAVGMGADVTLIDLSTKRLAELDQLWSRYVEAWRAEIVEINKRILTQNLKQPVTFLEIYSLRLEEELRRAQG